MQLKTSQEQSHASIILRLLSGSALEPRERRDVVGADVLLLAARNGVLIRTVEKLQAIGLESSHFLYSAAEEMRTQNQKQLAVILQIAKTCFERKIHFIFPNVLQNYPDMGRDIDIYVAAPSTELDAAITSGLDAAPVQRKLRNRIDGTATYRLAGCESLLDIHHGRVGLLGEHKLIDQLIARAKLASVNRNWLLVPSAEDQLILQAQKVTQRSYLRLSDLVTTFTLFRENTLDWNYILTTIRKLGISYDLGCYLNLVDQIHREAFNRGLPLESVRTLPCSKRATLIEFNDGFYRYMRPRIAIRSYANKFWSAVRSENWKVASRLSLLPLIALPRLVRRLRVN